MRCREARRLLSDLYHGTLPERLSAEVVAHLRSCPSCLAAWEAMEASLQALGALPVLSAPPEFRPSVIARAISIREGEEAPPGERRRGLFPALPFKVVVLGSLAALVLLGLALGGLYGRLRPSPERVERAASAGSPSDLLRTPAKGPSGPSPGLAPPLEEAAEEVAPLPEGRPHIAIPEGEFVPPAPPPGPIVSVSIRPHRPEPEGEVKLKVEFSKPLEWAMLASDEGGLDVEEAEVRGAKFIARLRALEFLPWRGRLTVIIEGNERSWLVVFPPAEPVGEAMTTADAAEEVAWRIGLPILIEGGLAERELEGERPESPVELARSLGAKARRAGEAWVIESGG